MHVQSSRHVATLWLGAILTFIASAWASTMLLPSTRSATGPTASYYVGLAGLLAIGFALVVTWMWLARTELGSRWTKGVLQALLAIGTLLWLIAMVFPFL